MNPANQRGLHFRADFVVPEVCRDDLRSVLGRRLRCRRPWAMVSPLAFLDEVDELRSTKPTVASTNGLLSRIQFADLRAGMSVSLVARQHGSAPNRVFTWHRGRIDGGRSRRGVRVQLECRALVQHQVRKLHRLLGKKTLEKEILRCARLGTAKKR